MRARGRPDRRERSCRAPPRRRGRRAAGAGGGRREGRPPARRSGHREIERSSRAAGHVGQAVAAQGPSCRVPGRELPERLGPVRPARHRRRQCRLGQRPRGRRVVSSGGDMAALAPLRRQGPGAERRRHADRRYDRDRVRAGHRDAGRAARAQRILGPGLARDGTARDATRSAWRYRLQFTPPPDRPTRSSSCPYRRLGNLLTLWQREIRRARDRRPGGTSALRRQRPMADRPR